MKNILYKKANNFLDFIKLKNKSPAKVQPGLRKSQESSYKLYSEKPKLFSRCLYAHSILSASFLIWPRSSLTSVSESACEWVAFNKREDCWDAVWLASHMSRINETSRSSQDFSVAIVLPSTNTIPYCMVPYAIC